MAQWSERLAAWEAKRGCANSAISANSPPFGTNGTNGTASPGPDVSRFDEVAGAQEFDHRQPRDVAEAVASLRLMPAPDGMSPDRWSQLVADADWFASHHWAAARAMGWTVREVFGVSPGFARRVDLDGLVTFLRGRDVGSITADAIDVVSGGEVLRFRRGRGAGAVPMWEATGG